MAKGKYLLAAAFAALAVPSLASVIVIGNTSARECFEAADSPLRPAVRDMAHCDQALRDEALSRHDQVATYVNRGILKLRRGNIQEAIVDFDTAIEMDPNQPESYLNKGAALIRLNSPAEALQLFTVALERNTRRPAIAHYGRAIAHEDLGDVRSAYQEYQLASELDPDWDDPRIELRRFRIVRSD
jgi:tetratricopeptide (TPR) repeat protein